MRHIGQVHLSHPVLQMRQMYLSDVSHRALLFSTSRVSMSTPPWSRACGEGPCDVSCRSNPTRSFTAPNLPRAPCVCAAQSRADSARRGASKPIPNASLSVLARSSSMPHSCSSCGPGARWRSRIPAIRVWRKSTSRRDYPCAPSGSMTKACPWRAFGQVMQASFTSCHRISSRPAS